MVNGSQHDPVMQSSEYRIASDEIDLLDIWRVLVAQRKLIFIVTLLSALIACSYAFFAPQIFKAEVYILPPLTNRVEPLNIADINKTTVNVVYAEAVKNLQSLSLRRRFFDEHNLIKYLKTEKNTDASTELIFSEGFNELLQIRQGKKDKAAFVTASLEGEDPKLIADWLNKFISMVNTYTVEELVKTLRTKINLKKGTIEEKIEGLRQIAANRRLDRVSILQEQMYIAEKLGIVKRNNGATFLPQNSINSEMGLSINTSKTPLYLRGTEELNAEIYTLQKRKNDDPFIPNLRNLQEKLAQLEKISINIKDLDVIRIDRMAIEPENPIKPKRKLIVALGIMLGLMLGFFGAFLMNFIEMKRDSI